MYKMKAWNDLHDGYWQCMDNARDYELLANMPLQLIHHGF